MTDKPTPKDGGALAEREAIARWLRKGGQFPEAEWEGIGFRPTLGLRLKAAWLTFLRPWAFARVGQVRLAEAIERGDHLKANP